MTLCTFGGRFAKTPKAGQPADLLQVGDWKAVFEAHHDFDAHAWPYVRYLDGELAPAVRVEARAGEQITDGDVLCSLVFLDYDESNDHHEVLARFASVEEGPLAQYAAIYPTKGGMRFVYRLAEPVTPAEYGEIARGLGLELFRRTGLKVDVTTDQWFRCFRLPSVSRSDGKAAGPTWNEDYYFEPIITDVEADPDDLPHSVDQLPWKKGRSAHASTADMPSLDYEIPDSRLRIYKRKLRSSRFKEYIFDDLEILAGRRDETLMAMAADAVGKCYAGVPESTAGEIFALLTPVALRMEHDGSETWEEKLWRMVQHCWNGEVATEKQRQEKDAADRSARDVVFDAMLKSMPPEIVPNDTVERMIFAQSHIFLQDGNNIYPLTPDGSYSIDPIAQRQMLSYLNTNGLLSLAPDGFRNDRGSFLAVQEVLNRNSAILSSTHYEARLDKGVDVIATDNGGIGLSISPFGLNQRLVEEAEIDPEIEGWLDCFPDPPALKRWLATALAIDRGPTSALYLMGPARIGKSMLAMGLAECFGSHPVTGSQAFSDFNGALRESPVILVDEGLPDKKFGLPVADQFRSLITGSGLSVEQKYMSSMQFNIPFRIVFTANSFEMVSALVGDRPLTGADRSAFEERIKVMVSSAAPAKYLDSRGAMRFTKESPKGSWIGGSCRLARHLIRNYQLHFTESEFVRDGRMLMQGGEAAALTLSFDLSGFGTEMVDMLIDYITKLAKGTAQASVSQGIVIKSGRVYARKIPLLRMLCKTRNASRPAFTKVLDRFLTGKEVKAGQSGAISEIDTDKLRYCALASGLDVEALDTIISDRQGVA